MQARVNYTAVGAFVLLLGAVLVVLGLWLGSGREQGDFRLYYAYSDESVAALGESSPVTYRGVAVGRITKIEIDPANPLRVRLTLRIRTDAPVKADTVATIAMQGLTGIGSLELTGGSATSEPLLQTPGSEYPVIAMQPSLMTRLDTALRLAMNTLEQASQRMLVILNDDNAHAIGTILGNTERLTANLARQSERLDGALTNVERIAANGARASDALPKLAPRVEAVLDRTDELIAVLKRTGEDAGNTARDSRQQLEYTGGVLLPQVERLVNDLGAAAGSLGDLGARLNANPQMLLLGPPRREPGPGEK